MNDPHEVISAFLDDEPVDANELAQALSEPDGRALLIDLVALRHVMQPPHSVAIAPSRSRSPLRALLAVAALLLAVTGGFWIGRQRAGEPADAAAPAATRVVEAGEWQPLP